MSGNLLPSSRQAKLAAIAALVAIVLVLAIQAFAAPKKSVRIPESDFIPESEIDKNPPPPPVIPEETDPDQLKELDAAANLDAGVP